jgi:hypothetical protein
MPTAGRYAAPEEDHMRRDLQADGEDAYEAPALTAYGTIEEWTRGVPGQIVEISVILDL